MRKLTKQAFTLIELLVVIAIIGILSGLVIVSMNGSVNSANDARRKSDISALAKAVLAYKTLNGSVPNSSGIICDIGSNCTGFPGAIVPDYIGSIPRDPDGSYYKYYSLDGISFILRSALSNGMTYAYSSSTGAYSSNSKNLLSLNRTNGAEDGTTTGFSDWQPGNIFTSDTTEYWQGSRSLKTVTANLISGEGFAVTTSIVSVGNAYTFSVYLKGAGTVNVCISESTSPYPTTCSFVTLTSTWTRYSVTRTMTLNNSSGVWPIVVTSAKQAATYYADGLQFEQSSSATAWVAGY